MPKPYSILLADDDPLLGRLLKELLGYRGFEVHLAANGVEARQLVAEHDGIRALALDLHMPGPDGVQTLIAIRELRPELPCCFISGFPDPYTPADLLRLGGTCLLPKPFDISQVAEVLRQMCTTGKPPLAASHCG